MKTPEFFRRLLSFPNLLVFLFTLPFLGIGVSEAVKVRQMLASFESATGIVIDNDYQTSPDPDDPAREAGAYFPVVKFSSSQGGNTTFTDGVGSIPPDYEIGDSVEILYTPQLEADLVCANPFHCNQSFTCRDSSCLDCRAGPGAGKAKVIMSPLRSIARLSANSICESSSQCYRARR